MSCKTLAVASLLEQFIESLAHIIALDALGAAARGEWHASIWFEVIAEVGLFLITHIIGLGLTALIVFARIEEAAVLTAVHVRITVWTFVCSRNPGDQFDLSSTIMTNHISPYAQPDC
jgi:hypothetical protein